MHCHYHATIVNTVELLKPILVLQVTESSGCQSAALSAVTRRDCSSLQRNSGNIWFARESCNLLFFY